MLEKWVQDYQFPDRESSSQKSRVSSWPEIFRWSDFMIFFVVLSAAISQIIKLSSKDPWLFPAILEFLNKKKPVSICGDSDTDSMLKGMDAYIATGSNNSARYFDYYFGKYPSLIRRNRTSIAILEGDETAEELEKLADDVFLYFGLGCRNVTQIHVPENYDFIPLLEAFRKYQWMADHNKYKNNYDYRLSLAILNKLYYMTNDCLLLLEDESPFSPISVLHYRFITDRVENTAGWKTENLQCIVGRNYLPFGKSQEPGLSDYADGADTMKFLSFTLNECQCLPAKISFVNLENCHLRRS